MRILDAALALVGAHHQHPSVAAAEILADTTKAAPHVAMQCMARRWIEVLLRVYGGPVIAQARIPVLAGDTPELAERLLEQETAARCVALIATGRIALTDAGALDDGKLLAHR